MKITKFKSGQYQSYDADGYRYFLPEKINHSFEIDDKRLQKQIEISARLLGELRGTGRLVTNIDLFMQSFINNEATKSSKIEGTRTNIDDTFRQAADISPQNKDDWQEVMLYSKAMIEAINLLEKLPISSRLIKQAHKTLLSSGRGKNKMPGAMRKSQNWIGGNMPSDAQFVPPQHRYTLAD